MGALYGELPDKAMLARIIMHIEGLHGFDTVLRQPPYPGKHYGGVITWPFRWTGSRLQDSRPFRIDAQAEQAAAMTRDGRPRDPRGSTEFWPA
jgi:hypothetical protein